LIASRVSVLKREIRDLTLFSPTSSATKNSEVTRRRNVTVWLQREREKAMFELGDFELHSGENSDWKIVCDDLTDDDLATIAAKAGPLLPPYGAVEGVPTGGLRLAKAMEKYVTEGERTVLIVDDVLTTGESMEEQRAERKAIGFVLVSRSLSWPSWVVPFFVNYLQPALFEMQDSE
jgi:hypothetical protein